MLSDNLTGDMTKNHLSNQSKLIFSHVEKYPFVENI